MQALRRSRQPGEPCGHDTGRVAAAAARRSGPGAGLSQILGLILSQNPGQSLSLRQHQSLHLGQRLGLAGRLLVLAALLGVAVGLFAPGSARAADDGVAQLQRFVETAPQATGRFTQTLVKEGGGTARPSSGTFAYARPGRFRWDIQKPYEQLIVTDGKQLSFYDKDLQQVTIKPVSEAMSATPAALLFGSGEIDRAFRLANEAAGGDGDLAWVVATPLSREAGFERLRIGMRGGLPARMEVIDAFGQQSRFEFDGIDAKATIGADQFRFTPPPGVDVVQ